MAPEDLQELTSLLEETPHIVEHLIAGLTVEDLMRKPSGKEFSIVEHVCHLRDIEQEGYKARINRLLSEDEPFLPDIDGDRLAQERDYNSQNPGSALDAFLSARENNVRTIRNLTADQFNRSGTLENVGRVTLEGLLVMIREHDQSHLKELKNLCSERSTGRPPGR